jgi:ion channel
VHRIHYRFGVVLGLILASLAFQLAAGEGDDARLIAVILQAATVIAAVIASRAHPWVIRLSVGASVLLVAGAAAAILGSDEFGSGSGRLVTLLLVALTPPAIVSGLVKHFREEGGITMQTMFGVLCLYLLIGLLFGTAFAAIEEISDDPFFERFSTASATTDDFLYFSFATLTTVGYGDLVAATNLGRSLAITEALIGQIYLVTVVAVIVSNLRPASRRSSARKAE